MESDPTQHPHDPTRQSDELPAVLSPDADPVRPASIVAASGILLTTGLFTGLVGLVLLVVVIVNSNPDALPSYIDAAPEGFTGAAGVIGMGLVVYGLAAAWCAIQAYRRRPWARGAGIVLAAIATAALMLALVRPGQTGAVPLIFLPVIVALAYAAVALASEADWFTGAAEPPDPG